MSAPNLRAALYAATRVPRRPALSLGALQAYADRRAWVVVEERWDRLFDPWHLAKVPDGWAAVRELAVRREVDVLLVGCLRDVAPLADDAVNLAAWAADQLVPVVVQDAGKLGAWYRIGPDPDRLAVLRRASRAPVAGCRGLPVLPVPPGPFLPDAERAVHHVH